MFWKSIDNNNRSTVRFISRLKLIVNGMVRDDLQNFDKTDLHILATLHNVAYKDLIAWISFESFAFDVFVLVLLFATDQ